MNDNLATEPEQIFYQGKLLEELSKDELIDAVRWAMQRMKENSNFYKKSLEVLRND